MSCSHEGLPPVSKMRFHEAEAGRPSQVLAEREPATPGKKLIIAQDGGLCYCTPQLIIRFAPTCSGYGVLVLPRSPGRPSAGSWRLGVAWRALLSALSDALRPNLRPSYSSPSSSNRPHAARVSHPQSLLVWCCSPGEVRHVLEFLFAGCPWALFSFPPPSPWQCCLKKTVDWEQSFGA